mmetsp:Transcript_84030/g.166909  ORF Transcript_84030/g.166909 Transcript_84030/m.166909 type:complete len:262 (-) Transcript_84030:852-1637(-)
MATVHSVPSCSRRQGDCDLIGFAGKLGSGACGNHASWQLHLQGLQVYAGRKFQRSFTLRHVKTHTLHGAQSRNRHCQRQPFRHLIQFKFWRLAVGHFHCNIRLLLWRLCRTLRLGLTEKISKLMQQLFIARRCLLFRAFRIERRLCVAKESLLQLALGRLLTTCLLCNPLCSLIHSWILLNLSPVAFLIIVPIPLLRDCTGVFSVINLAKARVVYIILPRRSRLLSALRQVTFPLILLLHLAPLFHVVGYGIAEFFVHGIL